MKLLYPNNGAIVEIQTALQREFIARNKCDGIENALNWLRPLKQGQELSNPAPVRFSWETDSEESVLELSENKAFENARVFFCNGTSIEADNLLAGQKYYWRVNGCKSFWFETADAYPRFIRIDGCHNVRDMGGAKIKQGLLYRGSELDRHYKIAEKGKRIFTQVLNIKTELDLRLESIGEIDKCSAGDSVRLVQMPYRPYEEIFEDRHRAMIVKIMELFADERNYPIYFHCWGGADRTGMLALYLMAIAGESEENMHLDYEMTSLSSYAYQFNDEGFRSRKAEYYTDFLHLIASFAPGEPFPKQILAFLRSCGVTEACMNKIKAIISKGENLL